MFIEINQQNENLYDMVFEFGNYINTTLQNENLIWKFIEDTINALIFLENHSLHYPQLRKRYSVFIIASNSFKLLNPYCFKDFLTTCSDVYCNPDKTPMEIISHSQSNINRNVKEFGIMTLALI